MNLPAVLGRLWAQAWLRGLVMLVLAFLLGRISVPAHESEGLVSDAPVSVRNPEAVGCSDRLSLLKREQRQLREELAYVRQSVLVEQEACFGVREALVDKEAQISGLQEQLAFYRGIVSPDEADVGVRIFKLELDPLGRSDYQFRLTLVQSVRQVADAKGGLQMRLVVLDEAGDSQILDMKELVTADDFAWDYRFRYYTELYGQFRLPSEVTPVRIEVTVVPKGRAGRKQSEVYVWNELIVATGDDESER